MNNDELKQILGHSVKNIREARNLTQEKLAELMNKDPGTIHRIEKGATFVTCDTFVALCNALNVPPSELLNTNSQIGHKEHTDGIKAINLLLQTFPKEKLKDAYNILNALNN